jgi:phosphoglycolate phosphatase
MTLDITMDKIKSYSHIFWDWNGTLYNDVDWCLNVMNTMLSNRGMKLLNDVDDYRSIFCFPVYLYYENVGFDFDKEPFELLAEEFITLYNGMIHQLYNNAPDIISLFNNMGLKQVVLSASEINTLITQATKHGLHIYINEFLGLSNIYAKSKIDIGLDYIKSNSITKALLIGDTEHDYEVATALGIDCILIADGHQNKDRLNCLNVPVFGNLSEFINQLN